MVANASGRCVADIVTPLPDDNACDGGTVSKGACICPSGFVQLRVTANNGRGTCVRTNAENCLGGEMTVDGKCLCSGQVTMSGETYLLEYSHGKCLPMNCPITAMKGGRCGTTASVDQSPEPERRSRPAPREARDVSDDEPPHRRHCGSGRVMTRDGCVRVRRHLPDMYQQYYRGYRYW
jgi:hypothetical protein